MLRIACPYCGRTLKGSAEWLGRQVQCPRCNSSFRAVETNGSSDAEFVAPPAIPDRSDAAPETYALRTRDDQPDHEDETPLREAPQPSRLLTSRDRQSVRFVARAGASAKPDAGQRRASVTEKMGSIMDAFGPARTSPRLTGAWWGLLFLVPLLVLILFPDATPFERLEKLRELHPEFANAFANARNATEALKALPEGRLPGAHVRYDSLIHWLYAGFAICGATWLLGIHWRDKHADLPRLLLTGLATATFGLLLLYVIQILAVASLNMTMMPMGRFGIIRIILGMIGYSYRCAIDPSMSFLPSFMGFTLGVGFCEELVKAIPVIMYLQAQDKVSWRGACLVGLASGAGFGIAESIHYSVSYYHGISSGLVYLVRFASCVALHAFLCSSVALLVYHNQDWIGDWSYEGVGMFVVSYLLISMVLHGLYNTLLKSGLPIGALVVYAGTFGWWMWLVTTSATSNRRESLA